MGPEHVASRTKHTARTTLLFFITEDAEWSARRARERVFSTLGIAEHCPPRAYEFAAGMPAALC